MLQIWATVTNLVILCWGAYLNQYSPIYTEGVYTEKRKDNIVLVLCILILMGWLSAIFIDSYISQQREIKIQKKISNFIEEGNQLKESCITEMGSTDSKPLYDDWVKRIVEYLSPLDPSYIPRLNMIVIGKGGGSGSEWDIWNLVNAKEQVLVRIIEERKMTKLGGF